MNHVQQSFNRAANTYDAIGSLQHQVANTLSEFICTQLPADFSGRLLDAGCGTGYCLKHLHESYRHAQFFGIDFAEGMLQQLPTLSNAHRTQADLQQLPVASSCINTYLSSLAWQWCDLKLAAQEAYRVLAPQGDLFVATLVEGTFNELAHCLQSCGVNADDHLLHCPSIDNLHNALTAAGLELQSSVTHRITTWHTDFKALRQTIRGVGANHLPSNSTPSFNRQSRAKLINAFEALRIDQGLPLSYEVHIIHARKP